MDTETNVYRRQLAGAVCRSIERTTPGFAWVKRPSIGAWLLVAVVVIALALAVVAMANKRAQAAEVYPLDVKAVRS